MILRKILVVIEADSANQPAVERAAALAELSGAEVELVLPEFNPYLADGYYFDPVQARELRYEYGERRMQELEELAKPLREQGISVSVVTAWGNSAHAEILKRAAESGASLVVKATRHHSKVARLLLAHTDWELVRHCPVPLLLVKGEPWGDNPVIVAAVDPNHINDKPAELDDTIIESAKLFASVGDGVVRLFHSAWVPPLSGLFPLQPNVQHEEEQLLALGEKHGIAASDCTWSTDPVTDSLRALIDDQHASLVVMGAVSRSIVEQALIGNTAQKLLDELSCDILVVRPQA